MHACALVVLPPQGDLDELLENALAPWREDDGPDIGSPNGFWDWWQIGGRYTGSFSDYDPETDPANIDEFGDVKWPTRWATHHGDIVPPAVILARPHDENLCWTILAGETVKHRQISHSDRDYPACFEDVPDFDDQVRRILQAADPASRVVVVDYHS